MSDARLVNITMVTFNRLDLTKRSLDSFFRNTQHPYVLNIVDNNSSDETREYLQELHRQGLVHNLAFLARNMGVSCAANLGWSLTEAPFYLRLDNDIRFNTPDWLPRMVDVAAGNPVIGPLSYPVTAKSFEHFKETRIPGGDTIYLRPGACCPGAVFMVRKDVHDKLGWWCEDYGLYGAEDGDYSHRAQQAGYIPAYMPAFDALDHMDFDDNQHYRSFKNRRQSAHQNLAEGTFLMNTYMYSSGLRPLRMERKYELELKDGLYYAKLDPAYAKIEGRLKYLRNTMAIKKDADKSTMQAQLLELRRMKERFRQA